MRRIATVLLVLLAFSLSASAQYMFVDLGSASPTAGSGNEILPTIKFDTGFPDTVWASIYMGPNNPNYDWFTKACNGAYNSNTGMYGLTSDDGTTQYMPDLNGFVGNSTCAMFTGQNGSQGNGSVASINGQVLQVGWHLKFTNVMVGQTLGIWYYGATQGHCNPVPAGNTPWCSGWQKVGTWTVTAPTTTYPALPSPSPVDFTPDWNENYLPITTSTSLSVATGVAPGTVGPCVFCAHFLDTGQAVVGASVTGVTDLDATPGSGFHAPHDTTGLGRPGKITPSSGTTGTNGCAQFTCTIPKFAGEYWFVADITGGGMKTPQRPLAEVVAYGPEVNPTPQNATNVISTFPGTSWPESGINWPTASVDPEHLNLIWNATFPTITRMFSIGRNYAVAVQPLANDVAPSSNRITLYRMGLKWEGWHDFTISGSGSFSQVNGDFHWDGRSVDIWSPYFVGQAGAQKFLGDTLKTVIANFGCTVSPANWTSGINTGKTIQTASVWHIACP